MYRLFVVLMLVLIPVWVYAQGRIIIPEQPPDLKSGEVYLQEVRGEVFLKAAAADIRLEQFFYNSSQRLLEGEYLFSLPPEAQIYDFYLYIDGKKTKGEILDAGEAAHIYEDIVRRIKDPALLEFTGYGLFKARIFPLEPAKKRKVELSYAQTLKTDGDMVRFTLPVHQSGQGRIESYHLKIHLDPGYPISTIYSPSHQIGIDREGESKATITLEASDLEGHKDFILYYSAASKEVDAGLLSFRPRTDRDGYFMLVTRPGKDLKLKVVAKDVIFVIDVSGSMGGEKIVQARDALQYCINMLNPGDRFEIISFSSRVRSFQGKLNRVEEDVLENARYFVNNLSASGGTNIDAAMSKALSLKAGSDERPTSIVFLTDGLPTEGEQDIGRLVKNIEAKDSENTRIFSFGVGYDVNTFLLDKLALDSGGSTNYVKPGEHIEREVSGFFAKITRPVLTGPEIDFGSLNVYDIFPKKMPDLFKGERAIVFGRYRTCGESEILLSGNQGNRKRQYSYSIHLPEREKENDFIASLWANRKVAHLMSRIRFEGETEELIKSVKNIAAEFGIVTPYTSYLVREQEAELAQRRNVIPAGDRFADPLLSRHQARELRAVVDEEAVGSKVFFESVSAAPRSAEESMGKGAVMASRNMKKVAQMEQDMAMLITVRRLSDKTFQLKDGIWIEYGLDPAIKPDRIIRYLSDAYFNLVQENPELRKIIALGEELKFCWNGEIYYIEK